jgi:ABC-2 type transport system ATP-binding protein
MLEVRGLTKFYGAVPAVRDVSFTVQRGEVLGYLGPNGSGKSTTVKMIVGLLEPTHGVVLLDGRNVRDDLIAYKVRIGYVPEEPHLYGYLTGAEYLGLVGGLRGLTGPRLGARIERFLSLLGLADEPYTPLASYSKGMRQKILIAAALLHDPDIIVLDEPFSGLDVTAAMVLKALVASLAAEGKIIVYSSHVLEVVERICSQVVILNGGRVVAHDSVARLRELAAVPTLEAVFSQLVLRQDVGETAAALAAASRL